MQIKMSQAFSYACFEAEYRPLTSSEMSKNFQKMVYIILNFLVLHFGENFMRIRTKIAKLQMHENLHKNYSHFYTNFYIFN